MPRARRSGSSTANGSSNTRYGRRANTAGRSSASTSPMTSRALPIRSKPRRRPLAMERGSATALRSRRVSSAQRRTIPLRPFCRIKRDDRHHVRFDMKARSCSTSRRRLSPIPIGTCHSWLSCRTKARAEPSAFRSRFGQGRTAARLRFENVEGCLYDVRKTSELLWAIDAEHAGTHRLAPVAGAIRRDDRKGLPRCARRSTAPAVQPEFPKPYLGYAAQAYYGGRVEARIVKTPLPCVYLDFLSMYPTVFALLGLWSKHIIPARLEVEEVPPEEIAALLTDCASIPKRSSTLRRGSGSTSLRSLSRTVPAFRRARRSCRAPKRVATTRTPRGRKAGRLERRRHHRPGRVGRAALVRWTRPRGVGDRRGASRSSFEPGAFDRMACRRRCKRFRSEEPTSSTLAATTSSLGSSSCARP